MTLKKSQKKDLKQMELSFQTSSQGVSHANHSRSQANKQEPMTTDTSGLLSFESSKSLPRGGLLEKMSWPALERGLERSCRTRKDFEVGSVIFCSIDDDVAQARDMMRLCVAYHAARFPDLALKAGFSDQLDLIVPAIKAGDSAAAASAVTDQMVEEIAVVGTAKGVREELMRYKGLIDWPVLMPPIGLTPENSRNQIERIIDTFGSI